MINLNVNGRTTPVDVDADTPLLWVLRDTLEMTGTKYGCGMAMCGSCTVHVDGQAMRRAALWHNPDASVLALGKALGLGSNTLANGISRGGLSRQQALAVEAFTGGFVTREQLAPKHFITSEA